MIKRGYSILKTQGASALVGKIYRRLLRPKLACFERYKSFFEESVGLEIGGPSSVFERRGLFPVYAVAARVDNCNFESSTVWEGDIKKGATFRFNSQRASGTQFICEATNLKSIDSSKYDFVLSSHALEHVANPLKALLEWKRILKPGGLLALVLPDKNSTFDHKRPITTLHHLIDDWEQQIEENDTTHFEEILSLHDLSRDPEAGNSAAFRARTMKNLENRCLHHHVFDANLAEAIVHHAGLQVLAVDTKPPFHIFVIAKNPAAA